MKGFIKITDVGDQEHYLNVKYVIRFTPTSEGHTGNSFIYVRGTQKTTIIQTSTTCQEIVDMIDLASK